jgi:hypothetical protein
MTRWLFALVAAFVLIVTGLLHGYWTDRWGSQTDTQEAADLLKQVPLDLGDWQGKEIEVKPGQGVPGVTGCVQRRYTHRHRGVTVVLALVNGRPGPVATHTPEVCYGASGYVVGDRRPVRLDIPGKPAQFWTSDAIRTKVTEEERIRLYWAWNGGDGWVASRDARQEFPRHRHPILHKLYVLRDLADGPADSRDEPCEAFLRVLLPELERVVFAKGS